MGCHVRTPRIHRALARVECQMSRVTAIQAGRPNSVVHPMDRVAQGSGPGSPPSTTITSRAKR
jgi:hypothetical protein